MKSDPHPALAARIEDMRQTGLLLLAAKIAKAWEWEVAAQIRLDALTDPRVFLALHHGHTYGYSEGSADARRFVR